MSAPLLRRVLAAAAGVLLAGGLLALAALPTGASSLRTAVPQDARVARRAALGDARVLLLSRNGDLRLLVAYRGPKGWLRVSPTAPPSGSAAAWSGTRGGGEVPALSAVYGRLPGSVAGRVRVRWADGRVDEIGTDIDGTFLVARAGRVPSSHLTLLPEGAPAVEIEGP